jgi:hypothetical protein
MVMDSQGYDEIPNVRLETESEEGVDQSEYANHSLSGMLVRYKGDSLCKTWWFGRHLGSEDRISWGMIRAPSQRNETHTDICR